ncbi:MAG: hypothetical protein HYS21_06145 [Deltaproteobacteria bacterium]|nr:hypothetical protein [Deltaproteobacteria bacterium]
MFKEVKFERLLRDKSGSISFKALFWIFVLGSGIYGAYKFVPPYFTYYMLRTDVSNEAKIAHMYTDDALERRILQKANAWSIPLESENLEIERDAYDISINVHYTETLNFFNKYSKDLEFSIEVQKPLKDPSRVLQ